MSEFSKLKGRTLVMVSTQDWDDLHTRKQRFAKRFAEAGCTVLYVEAQWHWLTYLKQHGRALSRLRKSGATPRALSTNLWLWTPPAAWPFFQIWEPLVKWNHRQLAPALQRALRHIGCNDAPLLYLYTPYNALLIDSLKPDRTLYECVDEYTAAKGLISASTVARLEEATLRRSDACVVTSAGLRERRAAINKNTHLIPNAADIELFAATPEESEPGELKSIPHPRFGFVGALNYWIDIPLLLHVALSRPAWQLVFVGPVGVSTTLLSKLPNVHFLGRKAYHLVPHLVQGLDVCLNPYVLDDVAKGCSPLKLYEYLASGKPVVSVPMHEAVQFAPPVYLGESPDKFVEACEEAIAESPEHARTRCELQRRLVAPHSWDDRFRRTVTLWESLLA